MNSATTRHEKIPFFHRFRLAFSFANERIIHAPSHGR